MRFGYLVSAIVLTTAAASASTIVDTFNQAQGNCNLSSTAPYSTCDVVGDPHLFDIQSATLSTNGSLATLMIYLNSGAVKNNGGALSLGSFSVGGLTLVPGDVFFYAGNTIYDPSDPTTTQFLKYGLALENHGGFVAGGLYNIGGSVGVETAQQALNNSNQYYRRDETVLMTGSGAPASTGSVTVANNGNGTTSAQYVVTVNFVMTSGLTTLMSNGQLGFLFSSADCGNDVIQGNFTTSLTPSSQAPEPTSVAMMAAGIVLLMAGRQLKKRNSR